MAQKGLILSNELHMLYLMTPVSLTFRVNWRLYHQIYKKLSPIEHRICDAIGIDEELIVAFSMSGREEQNVEFTREVKFNIPNTGTTPDQPCLQSPVKKFEAFADLNK